MGSLLNTLDFCVHFLTYRYTISEDEVAMQKKPQTMCSSGQVSIFSYILDLLSDMKQIPNVLGLGFINYKWGQGWLLLVFHGVMEDSVSETESENVL